MFFRVVIAVKENMMVKIYMIYGISNVCDTRPRYLLLHRIYNANYVSSLCIIVIYFQHEFVFISLNI